MINLDGSTKGGVRFMLSLADTLQRCRTDAKIDAQADLLRRMIYEVAARMKVEFARQKVEQVL